MSEEFGYNPDENLDVPPAFFPAEDQFAIEPSDELVRVEVQGVYAVASGDTLVVLLTDGERELPIIIGPYEASAIGQHLDGQQYDRPLTHDLFKSAIEKLNASIDRIVIDDLWNGTYYAKIFLMQEKNEIQMDARPSDAIALAVRFNCPVYVASNILEQAPNV